MVWLSWTTLRSHLPEVTRIEPDETRAGVLDALLHVRRATRTVAPSAIPQADEAHAFRPKSERLAHHPQIALLVRIVRPGQRLALIGHCMHRHARMMAEH